MLSTWGVVVDVEIGRDGRPDEAGVRCLQAGRRAYLDRCLRLRALLEREAATLRALGSGWTPRLDPLPTDGIAQVAVSAIEIRPSSVDFAFRIRWDAAGGPRVADGRETYEIIDGTGATIGIPSEIRDELIAIQRTARDFA